MSRLRAGQLAGAELLETLDHLEACSACQSASLVTAASDVAVVRHSLRTAESVRHLDAETEIIPYVDGAAPPALVELVETHNESCAMCRAETEDLQHLRTRLSPRRWWPMAVAAAIAAMVIATPLVVRRESTQPERVPRVAVERPASPGSRPARVAVPAPAPPAAPQRVYANPEWTSSVRKALSGGALAFSDSDLQPLQPVELRGTTPADDFAAAPSGIVITEVRPRFTWSAMEDATYVVSVFEGDEEVARSEALRTPSWTPDRDLQRGRTYVWQVEVTRSDGSTSVFPAPPVPQPTFRIVTARGLQEIAEAERLHPDDAVLKAVVYARHGLRAEAIRVLRQAKAGDTDARKLLQQSSP